MQQPSPAADARRVPAHATPADADARRAAAEAADDLAALLAAVPAADAPPEAWRAAYATLQATLRHATERALADSSIVFTGLFSRIDYLAKAHGVAPSLARAVGDARHRMRHLDAVPPAELAAHFGADLEAVCRFVAEVDAAPVPLPPALVAHFAGRPAPPSRRRAAAPCVRMAVARWDEACIYGHDAQGQAVAARYAPAPAAPDDAEAWADLPQLLAPGMQLNLVRPRVVDGVLCPELFIVDPDNLVNVTAVARCFETYAEGPVVDWLARLRPAPLSAALLMGNLAGQLIDEAVRAASSPAGTDAMPPYAESVRTFFAQNALALAACPDLTPQFHDEGRQQRQHILQAVAQQLPRAVEGFDARSVVTEPSFFSEMLGLQGRMDFLQLTATAQAEQSAGILIEQKAGKGAWAPGQPPDAPPRHREQHYVQLLLYMALLHYNYGVAHGRIYPFLFYSKYPAGLLSLGPAPKLLRRAIGVRNAIAAAERRRAEHGVPDMSRLTADDLNTLHARGPLWDRYTRPQLEALLAPIRQADDVERAYFHRFLSFVERERLMSKLGNLSKEGTGLAALWTDCADERRRAGNLLDGLVLGSLTDGPHGGVAAMELQLPQADSAESTNFRPGDIVVCYAYTPPAEPDARRAPLLRATMERLGGGRLVLRLRHEQTARRLFRPGPDARWAVEHDFMEASYASVHRGLHAFLTAPQRRRDLLLLRRQPEVLPTEAPEADAAEPADDFELLARRARRAADFFLLVGPPGTGKTSRGLMTLVRDALCSPEASVLLMAYTNRAVDEICDNLLLGAQCPPVDFLRLGSELSCGEAFRPHLLERRVESCRSVADVRAVICGARVVVGTTTTVSAHPELFALRRFTLAVVDEASQILEPHIVGLLSATHQGREAIGRFVLIGDHKQLPAVVQQSAADARVDHAGLRAAGVTDCRRSLFERLLERYGADPAVTLRLTRQGRMHRDIASFPNRAFYGGMLRVADPARQEAPLPALPATAAPTLESLLEARRVVFLDAPLPPRTATDKANPVEARIAARVVAAVARLWGPRYDAGRTVGIIVPYRAQITEVRQALLGADVPGAERVAIDTVERFQGSQREVVVYSFTIQRRYQLRFLSASVFTEAGARIDRKLNVALTRARERMVIIGHAPLLQADPTFAALLSDLAARGCVYPCPAS